MGEEDNMEDKQDVKREEAAAEAGPGAAMTDEAPQNTINDTTEVQAETAPDDEVAKAAPPKPKGALEESSTGKKAIIMLALCMAVFLAALDVTIITTALPTISEHFHSSAGYTWIGSAYLLSNAASTPSWGKVSDIFGRKPVLLTANVIFLVGSLVAALSNSIGMLIAARAVQGLGGGGLNTLVNICIGDLFSLRTRGTYYGIIGGVWAIASSVGPIVGGAFTEKVTWRWCFYVNLPLDGAAFLIILFFLDLKTPKTPLIDGLKAIDWTGSLAMIGGTLMLLFGLEYGGVSHPWDSALVLCLIIFGIVLLALFFVIEWKFAKYPVMPIPIFSEISNCAVLAVVFCHGVVFIAGSYYLPLYFQAVRGASPLLSGVYVLPTAFAMSTGSICTGIFIRKTGRFLPCIYFGFFFMTLGYGLFCDLYANSSWAKIVIFQIIAGLGIGPLFQSPLIALQARLKPRDIATATATFGFTRNIATAVSVVIGGVIYQNAMVKKTAQLNQSLGPQYASELTGSGAGANVQVIDALPEPQRTVARTAFANSLHTMWIFYVCISALGAFACLLIRKKELTRQHEVMKTGLDAEKANALEREKDKAERAEQKRISKAAHSHGRNSAFIDKDKDLEKGSPAASRPMSEVVLDKASTPESSNSRDA